MSKRIAAQNAAQQAQSAQLAQKTSRKSTQGETRSAVQKKKQNAHAAATPKQTTPHAAKRSITSSERGDRSAKGTRYEQTSDSVTPKAVKRLSRRRVHKRTSAFSVPSIPECPTTNEPCEIYEMLQEEIALLREEHQFPNNTYFKMGAAVAVSGLFDLGKLGYRPEAAEEVRRYLKGFGIRSIDDVRRLGINGICLADLEELYGVYGA